MKKRKIIWRILKRTGAINLLYGFLVVFFGISLAIVIIEPNINSFFDGIWYCFSVMTTIGFGDITAVTIAGRVLSIILSIYSILILRLYRVC